MQTSPDEINIGLIGLGEWAGASFVPYLKGRADIKVRAVAARTEATRQRAKKLFGPQTHLYSDYADLLMLHELDAVMIGVPLDLTGKVAVEAVTAGKHVFVEPPFKSSADVEALSDLGQGSGKVVHVDLELCYLPLVAEIRELLSAGRFGQLRLVRVELNSNWGNERKVPAAIYGQYGVWPRPLVHQPSRLVRDGRA